MGVSKNRGTPKWMVYNGKPYEQMDDLGENPLFSETPKFVRCYMSDSFRAWIHLSRSFCGSSIQPFPGWLFGGLSGWRG